MASPLFMSDKMKKTYKLFKYTRLKAHKAAVERREISPDHSIVGHVTSGAVHYALKRAVGTSSFLLRVPHRLGFVKVRGLFHKKLLLF